MTFDIVKILESKEAYRRRLAKLPLAEKLRILDEMRRRDQVLKKGSSLQRGWRGLTL